MKKTIITLTFALCLSASASYATTNFYQPKPIKTESVYKVNAFCVSIAKGDFETVKVLLARGENVNKTSNGMTPVMYAAKYNRTNILKLLISKGANLRAKNKKGYTALKYAELHGAKEAETVIKTALLGK